MTRVTNNATIARVGTTESELPASKIIDHFKRAAGERQNIQHRFVAENSPEFATAPASLRAEVARNEGNEGDVSIVAVSIAGQKVFALTGGDANQVWYGVYDQRGRPLGDLLQFFEVTPDWNITDKVIDAKWSPHRPQA